MPLEFQGQQKPYKPVLDAYIADTGLYVPADIQGLILHFCRRQPFWWTDAFSATREGDIVQRRPATVIVQGEQQDARPLRKRVAAAFLRLAVRVYKALQFKRRNRYVNVVAMT